MSALSLIIRPLRRRRHLSLLGSSIRASRCRRYLNNQTYQTNGFTFGNDLVCLYRAQESIEWFTEGQAYLRLYGSTPRSPPTPREYWTIYKVSGFLAVLWFGSPPTPTPPCQQFVSLSQPSYVSPTRRSSLLRGKGVGVEPSITTARKLGPLQYKSFNIICCSPIPVERCGGGGLYFKWFLPAFAAPGERGGGQHPVALIHKA
jgi:hypothetical protein